MLLSDPEAIVCIGTLTVCKSTTILRVSDMTIPMFIYSVIACIWSQVTLRFVKLYRKKTRDATRKRNLPWNL